MHQFDRVISFSLKLHAFPAERQGYVLQTSCRQRLPQSYPLLDSPDASETQSSVGNVLSILSPPASQGHRVIYSLTHSLPRC